MLKRSVSSARARESARTCGVLRQGLISQISQRRREVGLRLALGAGRRRIVSHFALLGMRVVGLACAAGLGLALVALRAQ